MSDGLPDPWWKPDEASRAALRTEVLLEVSDGHRLYGLPVEVWSRCSACDSVCLSVSDGSFALTHLTWSGHAETQPWPRTTMTGGLVATEWAQKVHAEHHADQHAASALIQMDTIVIEGEDPSKWVALIYYGPVVGVALAVGFFGPLHRWAAVLAGIAAGLLTYLMVAILVIGIGLMVMIVRGHAGQREFERDPRAFMERESRNRPEPPPAGPTAAG